MIKECLIASWVEHAKEEPELLDEERMRNSKVEEYYFPAIQSVDSIILVAECDDVFAGFIRANIESISSFFKKNKILFIDDVCVVSKFRKIGVAQKLLVEIEARAKAKNIHRLQGRVYAFNEAGQRLFSKMGYRSPHATWDKLLE